jgi:hypothetical protein
MSLIFISFSEIKKCFKQYATVREIDFYLNQININSQYLKYSVVSILELSNGIINPSLTHKKIDFLTIKDTKIEFEPVKFINHYDYYQFDSGCWIFDSSLVYNQEINGMNWIIIRMLYLNVTKEKLYSILNLGEFQ